MGILAPMKHDESRDLVSARTLLAEFEKDAASPEAHARLSEGLSFLSDVIDAGGPDAHVARNIGNVYAAKVAASAEAMLERAGESSLDEMRHWQALLEEFGRNGIEAPGVTAALAELSRRFATRYVGQLSRTEKKHLLAKLEEEEQARRAKGRR